MTAVGTITRTDYSIKIQLKDSPLPPPIVLTIAEAKSLAAKLNHILGAA